MQFKQVEMRDETGGMPSKDLRAHRCSFPSSPAIFRKRRELLQDAGPGREETRLLAFQVDRNRAKEDIF